jgi:hypothetical protein
MWPGGALVDAEGLQRVRVEDDRKSGTNIVTKRRNSVLHGSVANSR